MLVHGDGAQPSLPVLTDEDGVRIICTIDFLLILTPRSTADKVYKNKKFTYTLYFIVEKCC